MHQNLPKALVTGLRGGTGKTTLTLGILRNLKERGFKITPFKKGPDYIDAGWLKIAAEHECYNLDTFMMPEEFIIESFIKRTDDVDCALVEGNRGIFDGLDAEGSVSSAALAKLLNTPIILVVDCFKTTNTIGVIVKGIKEFDPNIKIGGVVLNYIAGSRHEKVVSDAIKNHAGLNVIGAIRRSAEPLMRERHMGLVSSFEYEQIQEAIENVGTVVRECVSMDRVWEIFESAESIKHDIKVSHIEKIRTTDSGPKIAVIKDRAFQFYYPENQEALENMGATVVEISVFDGDTLEDDIDALYIGGGFPETNARFIAKNTAFLEKLKVQIEGGLPVYAECGGLMFLGHNIIEKEDNYKMAGVFPFDFIMEAKPQAHGYTIVEVIEENPFFTRFITLKGHEFHYSKVVTLNTEQLNGDFAFAFKMKRGKGILDGMDGIFYKNAFATYTHLHAGASNAWVEGLVSAARAFNKAGGLKIPK